MGLSDKKQTTTQQQTTTGTQNQTSNQSVTPNNPQWVTDALQGFTGAVGDYAGKALANPGSTVAGSNQSLDNAFGGAGSLTSPNYNTATNLAMGAVGGNTPQSQASLFTPGQAPQAQGYQASGYSTYNAPSLGNAAQVSATNPGQAAQSGYQSYQAPTLGDAAQATTSNVDSQSLLSNLNSYMNPYTDSVVNSTLSDFDQNAGQTRAAQAAAGARNGAFGGSRYGVQEAETEGNLARARAAAEAGLRSNAFTTGAQLSADDAGRRQAAGSQNAQAANQTSMFNAGAQNDFGLANANLGAQAAQFGANAANQAGMFNAGAQNNFALTNAANQQQANLFNAGSQNDFASQNANLQSQAGQFNAGSANQFAGRQDAAAAAQADAANQLASQQYGAFTQAGLANAQAQQQNSQFNAGQQSDALARQLQASGLLGNFAQQQGADQRANIASQLQAGDYQRQLEQSGLNANYNILQQLGGLLGQGQFDMFKGVDTSGTQSGTNSGTANGTSTQVSSPSLFDQVLNAAKIAAMF